MEGTTYNTCLITMMISVELSTTKIMRENFK